MAIVITDRGFHSRNINTNQLSAPSSPATAYTPAANSVMLAIVQNDLNATDPDIPQGHDGGSSWVKLGNSQTANNKTSVLYGAHVGSSPSSGFVTVDEATASTMGLQVLEVEGLDDTGTVADSFAQIADGTFYGTLPTLALTGAATQTIGFWCCDQPTITPDDTPIGSQLSYRYGGSHMHRDQNPTGNAAPGATGSFATFWRNHAVEVVEASSGITGTINETSDNDTSVASGVVTVIGSIAETSDDDISVASGLVRAIGSLSETSDNDTSIASGLVRIVGSLVEISDNDTSVASGTVTVIGTLSETSDDDTMIGIGVVGGAITGTINETSDDDTSVASGVITVIGNLTETSDDDTMVGVGIVGGFVTGTINETSDNDTLFATGLIRVIGLINEISDNDTLIASGTVSQNITGTINETSEDDIMIGTGTVGGLPSENDIGFSAPFAFDDIGFSAPFTFSDINLTGDL